MSSLSVLWACSEWYPSDIWVFSECALISFYSSEVSVCSLRVSSGSLSCLSVISKWSLSDLWVIVEWSLSDLHVISGFFSDLWVIFDWSLSVLWVCLQLHWSCNWNLEAVLWCWHWAGNLKKLLLPSGSRTPSVPSPNNNKNLENGIRDAFSTADCCTWLSIVV